MSHLCPECNLPVSDDDSTCPNCGFPLAASEVRPNEASDIEDAKSEPLAVSIDEIGFDESGGPDDAAGSKGAAESGDQPEKNPQDSARSAANPSMLVRCFAEAAGSSWQRSSMLPMSISI